MLTAIIYCIIIIFLGIKYKKVKSERTAEREFRENKQQQQQQQHNFKPMPSPPTWPIIGHIIGHMHLLRNYHLNPWDGFNEIRKEYGNIVSLKMGIHQMALVSSSEAMREILQKKGQIFSDRPNFSRHHIIFGGDKENSLALCNWSNVHRDRRKFCKRGIVPKTLSRNQLLETIISKFVIKFVDNISNQEPYNQRTQDNNTSKIYYEVSKEDILFLTSDIFMDFLCSESYSHSDPEYKEFVHGCDFVFWDINQMYPQDFLPFLTTLGLGFFDLRKLKRVTDFLRDYIDDKIFEPRRQKHLKANEQEFEQDNNYDYLDTIIAEHLDKDTSMSLADYKVGFADLLAGHAAVSNILIRLLGHLALNKKIQDMICEEANQADIYNLKHIPSLPITEAALQEALRIASSPIVPHVAREDTSIDQYHIARGTMVLFNNYYINLSESLWSNPQEFDPTRFLEITTNDNGKKTFKKNIPKHFMPFSVGMRQCLGYRMVETISIVAVATICSKYIIKSNKETLTKELLTPKGSIALDPDAECFKLKLYPR